MNLSSYPESVNIFPNRPYWNEHGVWVEARQNPPICWCPETPLSATSLCEQCQAIRIRHLIFCAAEGCMVQLGKLNDIIKRSDCDLCSLIALACEQTWVGDWDDETARENTTCYTNALEPTRQQAKGYALQLTVTAPSNWQFLELELKFKGHGSNPEPVDRAFELSPKVDVEFLKVSIKDCEAVHDRCKLTKQPITPEKMLIIDVDNMSIKPAPAVCRYFALSYVWGKSTELWLTLTKENGVSLGQTNALTRANLPQTVRDAMHLCSDLGERFLWVDSLCIVQDDPVSQKQQINIMDSIYASATMTIVAGAGNHANTGLPGISKWSRTAKRQIITIQDIEISNILPRLGDTAERSVWNTRGWTYQERMFSRRCIFMTDAQAFYACDESVCYERKNRLVPTIWGVERLNTKSKYKNLKEFYSQAVQEYTLRSLTSQDDVFRAFQGVMNDMSRRWDQKFFFGLPNKDFEDALLWQEAGQAEKRIANVSLPSWTWAHINGAIKYSFTERRVISSTPLPAFWQDNEEPEQFRIDWLLNVDGSQLVSINDSPSLPGSPSAPDHEKPPADLAQIALQSPGQLLFRTQHAFFNLDNSVPFVTNDSWWTDYVVAQAINLSTGTVASILPTDTHGEPIGFIELRKPWAEQNLTPNAGPKMWEFLAISLATMDSNDFMNRHFTMRRNINHPLVFSRNVRELIVNVMLVEKVGDVRKRLGVGKIYLDCWEQADAYTTWVVLS